MGVLDDVMNWMSGTAGQGMGTGPTTGPIPSFAQGGMNQRPDLGGGGDQPPPSLPPPIVAPDSFPPARADAPPNPPPPSIPGVPQMAPTPGVPYLNPQIGGLPGVSDAQMPPGWMPPKAPPFPNPTPQPPLSIQPKLQPPPAAALPPPPQAAGRPQYPPGSPSYQMGGGLGPFLQSQFGLDRDGARNVGATLAAGLKAVGDNANKPGKFTALAGTMGAALQGGENEEHKNKTYNLAKLNSAIRNEAMLQQIPLTQARANILNKKAEQDNFLKDWRNTDHGKYFLADSTARKRAEDIRKRYDQDLKDASTEAKREEIRGKIKAESEAERQRVFREQNLDPNKAEKVLQDGFKGTPNEIKRLPPGSVYVDPKDGKKYTRNEDEHNRAVPTSDYAHAMDQRNDATIPQEATPEVAAASTT